MQERNGALKGMNVWKLPTGLSNRGENFADTAEREVLEETVGRHLRMRSEATHV